ncbi:hypothetical protein ACHAQA_001932 [Verticillium albo-atrum]
MRIALRTLTAFTSFRAPTTTSSTLLSHPGLRTHLTTRFSTHLRTMATSVLKKPVKLACVQIAAGADKQANLDLARSRVRAAADDGAKIIVLPECFNSLYGCDFFPRYAETLLPSPPTADQSPSFHALAAMAAETGTYVIGGSIPELVEEDDEDGKATKRYYNTSLTFGPDGTLLATHRKMHLFDIDIPGKITFRESDVLSPGNKVTIVDLPEYGKVCVAICYDVRFPEVATIAARSGCFALVYPGAFNLTTGPMHWKLLAQGRALDNQIYVAMCSPARDPDGPYQAWGHSMILDPLAQVVAETDEKESTVVWELDGAKIDEVRRNIPLTAQRRFDVYPDVSKGDVKWEEPGQPGASA